MKNKSILILTLISIILFSLTIRGNFGRPSPKEIEFNLSEPGKAFETSQERSRYAIILSLVNHGSFNIDNYASMGTPDIGKINGHYFSFFPPLTSILAIPFYYFGNLVNATQMSVFAISTFFSYLTMVMIILYANRLKLHWTIGLFCAISFGFATNAWGYSVTLYAHLISSFLIISALYVASFKTIKNMYINSFLIWLIYGIAVFIDFPNLFIFTPIAIWTFLESVQMKRIRNKATLTINWGLFYMPIVFIVLMVLYAFYNKHQFGNYTTLSNAIPRVKDLKEVVSTIPETEKTPIGALNTRNLLNGYNSFILSPDRGVVFFTPIVLLFTFAISQVKKFKNTSWILLLSVPAVCVTLYSMFGDPYGGWAFGSRYLIASFPPLLILGGIGLAKLTKKTFIKIIYSVLFVYSSAVSLLAPLTTNIIPPFVEAQILGIKSDYSINFDMLKANTLNSFVYNNLLRESVTGMAYYVFVLLIIATIGTILIWWPRSKYEN